MGFIGGGASYYILVLRVGMQIGKYGGGDAGFFQ